jgi:hypothetical protein
VVDVLHAQKPSRMGTPLELSVPTCHCRNKIKYRHENLLVCAGVRNSALTKSQEVVQTSYPLAGH